MKLPYSNKSESINQSAECAWDDSRKWQKILQLYEDEIAESLAKIIIARKCITKKTQRISTALNRVCAKGSKNKQGGKNVITGFKYKLIFYKNLLLNNFEFSFCHL